MEAIIAIALITIIAGIAIRILSRTSCVIFRMRSVRHHPADALPCCVLLAVVWPEISSSRSADSTAVAALEVLQDIFGLEIVDRQRAPMMTGSTAFALSETIGQQLGHAVGAD